MAQVELGRLRGLTLILTLSTGGVSPSGSVSLYLPEANALRLSTGVRPSMVCFSALRPRATVSQMVVLGFGLISSPILCRWPSRSD